MMVMRGMKQQGNDDNGEDVNYNKDNKVTLHNETISHVRGRWQQTRDDNGGGQEAAAANKRRRQWWT
jgi:hypothetical protein